MTLRSALTTLALLVVGAVGLVALIALGQRRLIYLPSRGVPAPAVVGLPEAEPVELVTDDGVRLGAWWVPPMAPSQEPWTILVLHGNGGHRAHRAGLARGLAGAGHAVLLLDYRGYGDSEGRPSEAGLASDARAARAWLSRRADAPPRIAYFGESLGTGVAVTLAAETPPDALVLRSPFTSLVDVAHHHYPWLPVDRLLRDRFESVEKMAYVAVPVLVVAGDRDRVVPLAFSRGLFDAAREPKRWVVVAGADHNDPQLAESGPTLDAVVRFLAEVTTEDLHSAR